MPVNASLLEDKSAPPYPLLLSQRGVPVSRARHRFPKRNYSSHFNRMLDVHQTLLGTACKVVTRAMTAGKNRTNLVGRSNPIEASMAKMTRLLR